MSVRLYRASHSVVTAFSWIRGRAAVGATAIACPLRPPDARGSGGARCGCEQADECAAEHVEHAVAVL
eukprot:187988-Rhodomonas_salina.1